MSPKKPCALAEGHCGLRSTKAHLITQLPSMPVHKTIAEKDAVYFITFHHGGQALHKLAAII